VTSAHSLYARDIPAALTNLCAKLDPTGLVFRFGDARALAYLSDDLAILIKAYGDARVNEVFQNDV
jgi:hypothetical protein